jgi:glutaredoxin
MLRILKLVIIAVCLQFAWKHFNVGSSLIVPAASAEMTPEQLQALARTVDASEIVMYSTPECTYCNQAKGWLSSYGFAFTDCNMRAEPRCEREFMSYGATGTPYLVVRGHHMKNGFDSDEFLALLKKS